MTTHISQQFEQELQDIRSRVLAMGGLVEKQLDNALVSLKTANVELAVTTMGEDRLINELEMKVDEECIQIIALRQPTASDLRLVTIILKAITDLERVGDEAYNIAQQALNLSELKKSKKNYRELAALGNHVQALLRDSLDAFARLDVDAAISVARKVQDADSEYESFMRTMLTYMMEDPRTISHVLDMMWSARALERIAAHTHNICEYVIYLVEGKDVRHLSIENIEELLGRD